MKCQEQNVLLYVDNAWSHIFEANSLTNVRVEFLTPNLTSCIQPLDAEIICAFKSYYRQLYIFCALALDEVNSSNINIYEIEQLEAMHLAHQAWNSVTKTTIQNCWQHAQILPL